MNASTLALLGYAAWTLALLVLIAGLRTALTLSGRRRANSFAVSGEDVSPFSARLCRAHANCYENLPVFGAIVSVALVTGNAHVTDPLALWVLAARVGQSSIHLISIRNRAILFRFAFLAVQVVIQCGWVIQLFGALA
jgi:hypothetical protein